MTTATADTLAWGINDLQVLLAGESGIFEPQRVSPVATAAAVPTSPRSLGHRLAAIDRSLKQRLHVAADAALKAALAKAGARIRGRAKKDSTELQAINTTSNRLVASVLGPTIVTALCGSADLLDGAWDDFGDEYDTQTAQAQRDAVLALQEEYGLDDDEVAGLLSQMSDSRRESRGWLLAALAGIAAAKLYHPTEPAAQLGEVSSATVPFGLIREAVALAGGQLQTADTPLSGVATGPTVNDFLATQGVQPTSYEWVYGAADRKQSFQAHEDLDGVIFSSWYDDVLLVNPEDDWLDTPYYFPGEHFGCQCDYISNFETAAAPEDSMAASGRGVLLGYSEEQPRDSSGRFGGGSDTHLDSSKAADTPTVQGFLFNGLATGGASQAKAEVASAIAARMDDYTVSLANVALAGIGTPYTVHDFTADAVWGRGTDEQGNPTGSWLHEPNTDPASITPGVQPTGGEYRLGNDPVLQQSLREGGVSVLVNQWAQTSNNSSARSLAMQEAAKQEFGLQNTMEWKAEVSVKSEMTRELEQHGDLYRAFVRAQYDETQMKLNAAGITHIELYRGVKTMELLEGGKSWTTDDMVQRPMSSFSSSRQTAESFGHVSFGGGRLVRTVVPAERVMSTPRSGVGCLNEQEFVVLAGSGEYEMSVIGTGKV